MKDIYELLNDIDMNDFEEVEVSELEKEKLKRSLKKNLFLKSKQTNKKYKKIIAVALIIFSIISLSFSREAVAQGIKILGELFQKTYGDNPNFEEYSDVIDRTISQDGIDITFHSAAISNDTMILDFTVKNNNEKITNDNYHEAVLIPTNLKINNKNVPTGAGASWEQIDDNTIRVIKSVDIGSKDFVAKGILNVEIIIDELFGERDNFNFKFKYDKTEQDKRSVSEKIDKTLDLSGNTINMDTISLSPLTGSVNFTIYNDNSDIKLGFIALDNNNKSLKSNGYSSTGSITTKISSATSSFLSNADMKSATFIPYKIDSTIENDSALSNTFKSLNLTNKESFMLNITDDFGVLIKDYIIDDNHLIIKYNQTLFGKESPFFISTPTPLIIKTNQSTLRMNDCNSTNDDMYDSLMDKYHNSNYELAIFKLDNTDNISIGVDFNSKIEFFKDKSITLDLPQ